MRKTIMAAMAASSLIAMVGCNKQPATNGNETTQTAAASADAINGTWKADINSVQFDTKPDEYLLQSGTYSCKSCTPTYSVAADGAFHAVSLPYADSDSVKVVDAHTVTESSKKGGRDMGSTTMTVSSDGNTLTGQFTDTSTPGAPSKGEFTETRVGPAAPSGAHVISGQWKPTKLSNFNDAALTFTVNVSGDTYKSSSPDGTSYEAKIGGGDVPISGRLCRHDRGSGEVRGWLSGDSQARRKGRWRNDVHRRSGRQAQRGQREQAKRVNDALECGQAVVTHRGRLVCAGRLPNPLQHWSGAARRKLRRTLRRPSPATICWQRAFFRKDL